MSYVRALLMKISKSNIPYLLTYFEVRMSASEILDSSEDIQSPDHHTLPTKRKRSSIFAHYTQSNGKWKCNHCRGTNLLTLNQTSSTTTLWRHMRSMHRAILDSSDGFCPSYGKTKPLLQKKKIVKDDRLDESDQLAFHIVGTESLEGRKCEWNDDLEDWAETVAELDKKPELVEKNAGVNYISGEDTQTGNISESDTLNSDEHCFDNLQESRPSTHSSESRLHNLLSRRERALKNQAAQMKSEEQTLRAKKIKLLELDTYKRRLEIFLLERQLGLPPSKDTVDLHQKSNNLINRKLKEVSTLFDCSTSN